MSGIFGYLGLLESLQKCRKPLRRTFTFGKISKKFSMGVFTFSKKANM